jgi:hypothetical protein
LLILVSRQISHLQRVNTGATIKENSHHTKFPGNISSVVDPPIHGDELLYARLVLNARVVQARVEHDDGKREDVTRVRVVKFVGFELTVALRTRLHHAVYLLRLAGETEGPQKLPKSGER